MSYNLITILGPTAVGKTRLAASLANHFNGEIISADSRQVYKGMDIGTGKDLADYIVDGQEIPYHLIDVIEPGGEFNLFLFNKLFYESYHKINSKNKIPFLVGGTGLFIHSILSEYNLNKVEFDLVLYNALNTLDINVLRERLLSLNPKLHNSTDLLLKDRVIKAILIAEKKDFSGIGNRVKINSLTIGIRVERETVRSRITERLRQRLENGMIEEIQQLLKNGITFDKLNFFGLEYKFIGKYLKGELDYEEMFQKLNSSIHNFAKRQMTWFRKMEREGIEINWIDGADYLTAEKIISNKYSAS
ncbi:MAG: tRNA (adenosine(37)-N6)-dimethylallyltransferase MiaA [Melioribacteraceae bacterium]|nr:tRNA (adenosine(37)-N6)-dimethylallyltransferase MiaA [Melioribacteraceae bacterium]